MGPIKFVLDIGQAPDSFRRRFLKRKLREDEERKHSEAPSKVVVPTIVIAEATPDKNQDPTNEGAGPSEASPLFGGDVEHRDPTRMQGVVLEPISPATAGPEDSKPGFGEAAGLSIQERETEGSGAVAENDGDCPGEEQLLETLEELRAERSKLMELLAVRAATRREKERQEREKVQQEEEKRQQQHSEPKSSDSSPVIVALPLADRHTSQHVKPEPSSSTRLSQRRRQDPRIPLTMHVHRLHPTIPTPPFTHLLQTLTGQTTFLTHYLFNASPVFDQQDHHQARHPTSTTRSDQHGEVVGIPHRHLHPTYRRGLCMVPGERIEVMTGPGRECGRVVGGMGGLGLADESGLDLPLSFITFRIDMYIGKLILYPPAETRASTGL
ncbi:hypothetical protein HK104_003186 [Borealophlyctis nickersoniae]|nr:hypothetical protein HK104_003186 [Borealophlyctis nickersoniae]